MLDGIAAKTGEETFSLVNADAMVNTLSPEDAREVRYHQEARLLGDDDMLVHVNNDGLQYLSLDKSPCGFVGTTSLVEYSTEPP